MRVILLSGSLLLVGVLAWQCMSPRHLAAYQQIERLNQSALRVRLIPARGRAAALEFSQGEEAARALAEAQASENQKIVEAFHRAYDFSPVYFFYGNEPEVLYRRSAADSSLVPLSPDSIAAGRSSGYLIAEFGTVYDSPFILEDEDGRRRQAGGTGGLPALVIKNSDGIQLEAPFPFRVITSLRPDDRQRAVWDLNRQFHAFYLRAQRKRLKREMKTLR